MGGLFGQKELKKGVILTNGDPHDVWGNFIKKRLSTGQMEQPPWQKRILENTLITGKKMKR
jgi:hypothetical protein